MGSGRCALAFAALEPEQLSGEQAASLVELFTEIERIGSAYRTLVAHRVEETKIWQRDGHRTVAEWMAAKTGTTVGQAIGVLETSRHLDELPLTRDALRSGLLSEVEAREVSSAAFADPRSERTLLAEAQTQPVETLRAQCRRVLAAAIPDETARYEPIRKGRYFRHRTDPDGAVRLDARLTPDVGASVIAEVESRQARIFAEARAAGVREASEAYAADALVELLTGSKDAPGLGPRGMVHVLVDHSVLRSGQIDASERCEIPGIGPIPAATARSFAGDAILKAVVTRGSDVHSVVHIGRTIPAKIRTALEVRDEMCVVPGCGKRNGLEIDHYRVAFADGGPTQLDNLARLCRWHHYQKTHLGYRLTGAPGSWRWQTPADLEGTQGLARPPPHS